MGCRVDELFGGLGHTSMSDLHVVISCSHPFKFIIRPDRRRFRKIRLRKRTEERRDQTSVDVYVDINKDAESDPGVKAAAAAWFKRMEDTKMRSRIGVYGASYR
jgi:hypothetical protein